MALSPRKLQHTPGAHPRQYPPYPTVKRFPFTAWNREGYFGVCSSSVCFQTTLEIVGSPETLHSLTKESKVSKVMSSRFFGSGRDPPQITSRTGDLLREHTSNHRQRDLGARHELRCNWRKWRRQRFQTEGQDFPTNYMANMAKGYPSWKLINIAPKNGGFSIGISFFRGLFSGANC